MPDPSVPPDPLDPLDVDHLRRSLAGRWPRVDVVERTGSTNADLLAAARAGAPDRTVLAAEHQDAGRGRRTRTWEARPSEGLTVSALLRPTEVPPARRGWAPLLAGLALVAAIERCDTATGRRDTATGRRDTALGAHPALKWPNDLLLGAPTPRKCAGILVEADGVGDDAALVVGIGLNVATDRARLPEGATSLAAEGLDVGRTALLDALLVELAELDDLWRAAAGDVERCGLLARYRAHCATLSARVRVLLPGDRTLEGTAVDVDASGHLFVRGEGGDTTRVSAGDVVHVRAAAG